jgi:glucose/arabinose dehydrogenase
MWRVSGRSRRALAAAAALGASSALATVAASGAGKAEDPAAKRRAPVRLHGLAHFDQPTFVAAPNGARKLAFVTERKGKIRMLQGKRKVGTFLDMRKWVGCCEVETGLLSVAFAPKFKKNRRFYVYFTNNQRNIEVDEFKRSKRHPRRAKRGSRRRIISVRQTGPVNHNGGTVAVGANRMLYIATGDGGNFQNPSSAPQRKSSLLGKLLRIDPRRTKKRRYRIPRSNPYVGKKGRNEIYARGLRNPFRISLDRKRIFIADVGEDRREEVNVKRIPKARGANFGWPIFEGTLRFRPGHIARHDKPVHQYSHRGSRCSITGGVVIRDRRLRGLRGRYVYGDYCSGEIRTFRPRKGHARKDHRLRVGHASGPVAFGVDGRRRVYVVELNSGQVSRLDPRR